ncbi:MAG TPA: hypothetical protein VMR73_01000 [Candidatus Paceibacterota bacterium]|nr:hypothetical protein [Candidatus Paceibacterota bacterium]
MPEETKKEVEKTAPTGIPKIKEESTQTVQLLMQKIIGEGGITPTSQQFDEILAQRKTVYGYIHDERMQDHEKFKISSKDNKFTLVVVLLFILIISGGVLIWRPDYFTQVISALLGFAGGFGFGRSKIESAKS